jgi:hypothetical protein
MLSEGKKVCAICPHVADCAAIGSCLDETNKQYLTRTKRKFSSLMTPSQADAVMSALRQGHTIRRITNGKKIGVIIVTVTKFDRHCATYPIWGAEAGRLRAANALAADRLKGSDKRDRTHCARGHEFAVHGLAYKNHVNGRRYRYCKLCNKLNSRKGGPLPFETVEKVKALVRGGAPLGSFTSGGKPGYLCRFASVKLLQAEDPEFNNLVRLGAERRKMARQPALTVTRPHVVRATNLPAPALVGCIAGGADIVFSAVQSAVSPRLPRHIRDEVMGQIFLDVEEGRIAFNDIARFARKYTSAIYAEERYRISLDEPTFRDGSGSRLDQISEADGLWS